MNVNIENLTELSNWDSFLKESGAGLFLCSSWLKVLRDTYGYKPLAVVVRDVKGQIKCAWPFTFVADVLGKRLISLPFSDVVDPASEELDKWAVMLEYMLSNFDADIYQFKTTVPDIYNAEGLEVYRKAWLHRMPLTSEESYWACAKSSHKRAVRKARRKRLRLEIVYSEDGISCFYDLHRKLRKEKMSLLPQPYSFFKSIQDHFLNKKKGFVMVAVDGQKPIAASVFLCGPDDYLYYKFGASDMGALDARPNNFLMHEAIIWAVKNCFKGVDFGLSGENYEGLIRFKDNLGAKKVPLRYVCYRKRGLPNYTKEFKLTLSQLTKLLTREDVPDEVTTEAGKLLYSFFA